MVSKQFHDKHGEEEIYRKGAGSGPFRVKEWLVDNKVILERFDGYWKQGADGKPLPYLDGAELNYRPDKPQAVIDLRAGTLDAMEEPPPRDVEKIKKDANTIYIPLPPAERSWPCLALNARRKPFQSTYLRKAAFYALDREKIAKIMGYGVGKPHQYPYITEGQIGWGPAAWPDYSYNPDKARELLEKDYPTGVDTELFYIEREPDRTIAQLVKSMWDKVGIRTKMGGRERLGWIETMRGDTYEAAFWSAPTRVGTAISYYLKSDGRSNWGNYKNPAVDLLLKEYDRTTDTEKSHDLMRSALGIIWMDAELTTGYSVSYAAATRKNIHGLLAHWDCLAIEGVWKSKD
jgi:peptide/nickel transport system substrate-binding protein